MLFFKVTMVGFWIAMALFGLYLYLAYRFVPIDIRIILNIPAGFLIGVTAAFIALTIFKKQIGDL